MAAIFVSDPDQKPAISSEAIRDLYALTPAEASVAALLATGSRLEGAAAEHGVQLNTVRIQLKQVFDKTGTHRQADLVRLLLTGPAQFCRD